MTQAERGFLLLGCDMGQAEPPLTTAQLRNLRRRARELTAPDDGSRPLDVQDLLALGYSRQQAERIVRLLERTHELDDYLALAREREIFPLSCISPAYPATVRQTLGDDCPAALFYCGHLAVLERRKLSLVGSRRLTPQGAEFAKRVGVLAAQEGFALVTGNAPGADQTAARACLDAGGWVIYFPADALCAHRPEPRTLWLAADGWHLPFSAQRALSRNRLIHALGEKTFVAQCAHGVGGTWSGTEENLRRGYSPVFVHADGSAGAQALQALGAAPVKTEQLVSLDRLWAAQTDFLG
ncbi:MAG: DNA-processing protein DprA [Firmicutes bacterium]|nr:DNA-processing protein DprA [Bacillota bacterium]MDY2719992.1 DNA-processing protein DprA [Candidatus Faecousia sp.]